MLTIEIALLGRRLTLCIVQYVLMEMLSSHLLAFLTLFVTSRTRYNVSAGDTRQRQRREMGARSVAHGRMAKVNRE